MQIVINHGLKDGGKFWIATSKLSGTRWIFRIQSCNLGCCRRDRAASGHVDDPLVSVLHLYDVVNSPGVTADINHMDTDISHMDTGAVVISLFTLYLLW